MEEIVKYQVQITGQCHTLDSKPAHILLQLKSQFYFYFNSYKFS